MKYLFFLTSLFFYCFHNIVNAKNNLDSDYYNDKNLRYENYTYNERIKTVRLHPASDVLKEPILRLNGMEQLQLSFDEIGSDARNFMYTFIHCDMNWKPSNITQMEYMEGFFENYIVDFEYSFNTMVQFVHYDLMFPNEDVGLLISGNYIIKVFDENDPEIPVLTQRFMVVEPRAEIDMRITRASKIENRNFKQRVDFSVDLKGINTPNPQSDIKTVILQNSRWDNAIVDLPPLFVDKTILRFNYDDDSNAFWGGNEFRFIDLRSLQFKTDGIAKIAFQDNKNYVLLREDERRKSFNYVSIRDVNGRYKIFNREGKNHHTDADYSYVHFRYKSSFPFTDEDIYVFGELTNWNFHPSNKMKYNEKHQLYETTLFLKQGYYNYEYVLLEDGKTAASNFSTEGSHFETENDYTILVYLKKPGVFYDQLIGVKTINSLSQMN